VVVVVVVEVVVVVVMLMVVGPVIAVVTNVPLVPRFCLRPFSDFSVDCALQSD
jgi:hypothetical protein